MSGAGAGAPRVRASAASVGSASREEVFEQHGRRACIEIGRATVGGFRGRETLVVQVDGNAERCARVGEPTHTLRLRPVFTSYRQRKTDDQGTNLLFRDQLTEARKVGLEVASRQRTKRPREAEGVVTDGEADAAIADVQRKIPHAQGEAADVGVSTSMRRRESKNGNRGHQPGQIVMRRTSRPCPSMTAA